MWISKGNINEFMGITNTGSWEHQFWEALNWRDDPFLLEGIEEGVFAVIKSWRHFKLDTGNQRKSLWWFYHWIAHVLNMLCYSPGDKESIFELTEHTAHDTDKWTCQTSANGVSLSKMYCKHRTGLNFKGREFNQQYNDKIKRICLIRFSFKIRLANYKVKWFLKINKKFHQTKWICAIHGQCCPHTVSLLWEPQSDSFILSVLSRNRHTLGCLHRISSSLFFFCARKILKFPNKLIWFIREYLNWCLRSNSNIKWNTIYRCHSHHTEVIVSHILSSFIDLVTEMDSALTQENIHEPSPLGTFLGMQLSLVTRPGRELWPYYLLLLKRRCETSWLTLIIGVNLSHA